MTIEHLYPTGSRYIVPRVKNNDRDYVCLSHDLRKTWRELEEAGFVSCIDGDYPLGEMLNDEDDPPEWFAVRRGDLNLMVVGDEVTYFRWLAATELARALMLETRPERVALFELVREGNAEGLSLLLGEGAAAATMIQAIHNGNVQEDDNAVLRSVGLGD